MFWNRYLLPAFALAALVAALNWLGNLKDYYYTTVWYDWPMHFLGGATIAALLLWKLDFLDTPRLAWLRQPRNLILYVFAVGIAWEVFEVAFHLNSLSDQGYAWDTAHDLIMDVIGGAAVVWIARLTAQKR
ncbi:MAG TPA: hypothetical protein VFQ72_01715 [Candidatus Paceibacterota bacterium]|nr:hypothetical protein [Candidatus Paceibacterota bacterium]